MSDEEKKAIEILKLYFDNPTLSITKYVNIVLNLIEKQSKEIEELKTINRKLEARKYMFNAETGEVYEIPIDNNYISKDKIKAKIEESKLLIDNSQGCMSNEDLYKEFGKIEFGKSLLEKE